MSRTISEKDQKSTSAVTEVEHHHPPLSQRSERAEIAEAKVQKSRRALHRRVSAHNPVGEQRRATSGWLREVVGWGVFLGILFTFFAVQNYFNGVFNGLAKQVVLAMSVILEIGLIWFWDRFWY